MMPSKTKAAMRRYMREWRKKHPDYHRDWMRKQRGPSRWGVPGRSAVRRGRATGPFYYTWGDLYDKALRPEIHERWIAGKQQRSAPPR
jgi:hypothetical protein